MIPLKFQASVRRAASEITALTDRLDVMINNASIGISSRQMSPDGIELTFATNHLGPFLLTTLLTPLLQNAAATNAVNPGSTRVVNVTSAAHWAAPIRFHDINFEAKPVPPEEELATNIPPSTTASNDGYQGFLTYGQSKTANILLTVALRERYLKDRGIDSFSVDPGCKTRSWHVPQCRIMSDDHNFGWMSGRI